MQNDKHARLYASPMEHDAPTAVKMICATALVGRDFIAAVRKQLVPARVITVTHLQLVKGNLRKGACKNRATASGTICGNVFESVQRTLGGKLIVVKCLGCGVVKRRGKQWTTQTLPRRKRVA